MTFPLAKKPEHTSSIGYKTRVGWAEQREAQQQLLHKRMSESDRKRWASLRLAQPTFGIIRKAKQ